MKVVFRVDASVQMGSGHLMRCLTLAEALQERGVDTRFICRDHVGNLNTWLQKKGFAVTVLPQASVVNADMDAQQTMMSLKADRPDWMIVDHYGLDIEWERRLKPLFRRLLVIDDHTGRSHDCDLLLDQNYSGSEAGLYDGLVPVTCKLLLGTDYALLRKEFSELRKHINYRQYLKNILVFFTGGDDQGETLKAMKGIEMFGLAMQVNVVVGYSNPHNELVKQKCAELRWGYHCQVDYMPHLISKADLVIGAGGSSNWERCSLGVPALVAILAENQTAIAQELDNAGAVSNLGWFHALQPTDYAAALSSLDAQRISDMSCKAMGIVDASGAKRVAEILLTS